MRRRVTPAVAAAALLLVTAMLAPGCRPASEPRPVPPASTPSSSIEPSPSVEQTAAALDALELELVPLARGLDSPVYLTHSGDGSGRLFVVEQGGRIRIIRGGSVAPTPYLDISDSITTGGERGLLGLAFDREFENNGRFFVNYTDRNGDTVIAAYEADDPAGDTPSFGPPKQVLKVEQPYANHNGGCIVIGPDGRLWIGMGDGGSGGDPHDNAQNPKSLLGKMIALEIATDAEMVRRRGRTNPWGRPVIVAQGVRNPWRFSFDRTNGDLWIGDVGQNAWEEIDQVSLAQASAGTADFGWNLWEGRHPFPKGSKPGRSGFTFPVVEYSHDKGNSVTGGYVYRGSKYPALRGTYLYADFGAGWVAGVQQPPASSSAAATQPISPTRMLVEDAGAPSSFGEDENGELYLVDYGGTIYSIAAKAR